MNITVTAREPQCYEIVQISKITHGVRAIWTEINNNNYLLVKEVENNCTIRYNTNTKQVTFEK